MSITRGNNFFTKSSTSLSKIMKDEVKKVNTSMITSGRFIPFNDVVRMYDTATSNLTVKSHADDNFRKDCYAIYGEERATNYFESIAVLFILRDVAGKLLRSEISSNNNFRDEFSKAKAFVPGNMMQDLIVSKFGYGECGERATRLIFNLVPLINEPLHRILIEKSTIDNHVFVLAGELPAEFKFLKDLKNIQSASIFGDALFNLSGDGSEIQQLTDVIRFNEQCILSVTSINPVEVEKKIDLIDGLANQIAQKMIDYKGLFEIISHRASKIKENGKLVDEAQPIVNDFLPTSKPRQ